MEGFLNEWRVYRAKNTLKAVVKSNEAWLWYNKTCGIGPGWIALLGGALSRHSKAAGSILGQGTCENQPMNSSVSETTKSIFFSLKKKKLKNVVFSQESMEKNISIGHC